MMTSSDGLTSPARLLRIASWVIAIIFAVFLNMLGSLVIRDMAFAPRGGPPVVEQFADAPLKARLDAARRDLQARHDALAEKADAMEVARGRAAKEYAAEKESFRNWLATRSVTGDSARDPDILARTRKLDTLQAVVVNWQHQIDAIGDQQRSWHRSRLKSTRKSPTRTRQPNSASKRRTGITSCRCSDCGLRSRCRFC